MKNGTIIEGAQNVGDTLHYRERVRRLPGELRFRAVLGKGAHGAALLVSGDGEQAGTFVVKMLRHELLASDNAVARFRRELSAHLRLSRSLQVPRVVRCTDRHDDVDPSLIHGRFPYYGHGNLTAFMAHGATVETALGVLVDALEGLQALHGHGYVHRDVCPVNIFVGDEGGAQRGLLGDLGVGMFLEANTLITEDELLVERQLRVGHEGFADSSLAATEHADLHGVGTTLYWILTGRETPPAAPAQGLALPPLENCRPGVAADLHPAMNGVLARLTCASMNRRYPTAADARLAIANLIAAPHRSGPVLGRPPDNVDTAPAWGGKTPSRARYVRAAGLVMAAMAIGWMAAARGVVRWPAVQPTAAVAASLPAPVAEQGTRSRGATVASAKNASESGTEAEAGDLERLLALAVSAPLDSDPGAMERDLWKTVDAQPRRGELRLALARVLAGQGRGRDATGLLAAAPARTTYREEIRQLHDLLIGSGTP